MPPTEAGSSLGCSGCRPAAAAAHRGPTAPTRESLQSLPPLLPPPDQLATRRAPDDVWAGEWWKLRSGCNQQQQQQEARGCATNSAVASASSVHPELPTTPGKAQAAPRQRGSTPLICANCPSCQSWPLVERVVILARPRRWQKEMLPGAQFAWDQFAVCEQCGETSQHAATHPKVNIESQGLERTARLPDYRSSDLAMLTDDNDIDAVVDSTI